MKILWLLIIIPMGGYCQPTVDTISRWSIGVSGSSDYYIYDFSNDDGTGINNFDYKRKINFSIGLCAIYKISNRFSLQVGSFYSEKGFKKVYEIPDSIFDENVLRLNYFLDYIDISIILRYNIFDNKVYSFFTSIGIVNSLLISKSEAATYKLYKNRSKTSLDCTKVMEGISTSFCIEKKMNKKFILHINPTCIYSFYKINQRALKSSPFVVSLNLSVLYNL